MAGWSSRSSWEPVRSILQNPPKKTWNDGQIIHLAVLSDESKWASWMTVYPTKSSVHAQQDEGWAPTSCFFWNLPLLDIGSWWFPKKIRILQRSKTMNHIMWGYLGLYLQQTSRLLPVGLPFGPALRLFWCQTQSDIKSNTSPSGQMYINDVN